MTDPPHIGEDVVHGLRRRLAEYASTVDTLGGLADSGTEPEVIDAILDLVGRLCASNAIAFIRSPGAGSAGAVTRPPSAEARSSTAQAAADLHSGEEWALLDRGFVVRVGLNGMTDGVIAVVGLARPEHREEYVETVTAVSGVMAMALHSVRTREEVAGHAQLYRLLAENATDAVFLVSPQWRFTWVSPATRNLLGYDADALVGTDTKDIIHPDDLPALAAVREPLADGRIGVAFELRVRTASGEYRWMSGRSCEALDEHGMVTGRITTLRDINEQVLARQELVEQRERLQLVLGASGLGLWDWNMQTDEGVVDEQWAQILGYRLTELEPVSSDTWRRLTHPDDLVAEEEMTHKHGEGLIPYYDIELRFRHRDGHWVWTHDRGRIVQWTSDGRPLRMSGTMEDISELVSARAAAQAARDRLQATMDSLLDPHVFLQAVRDDRGAIVDFIYVDANEAACAYNHMTREDTIGARLLDVLPGHRASGLLETYGAVVDTGIPYIVDGQPYFNEILDKELRSDVRGIKVGDGLSLTWREVTEQYESAAALARSEERYRLLAENVTDVVAHVRDDTFIWVSASVQRTLGWQAEDVIGQHYLEFVHPEDREQVRVGGERMAAGATGRGRYRTRAKDGSYHWIDSHGGPLLGSDGTQDGFVVSVRVVDAEVRAQENLEIRARHDQLTGLANREEVFERLRLVLGRSVRSGSLIAVVFCDFDDFKNVNDTFGHAGGDSLLRIVADRFRAAVRTGDVVARIGGDEMLVVLDGVHDLDDATAIAEKLRKVVRQPVEVPGGVVQATMSFGVTIAARGESLDDVIARADGAMYRAKQDGRDQVSSVGLG